MVSTEDSFSLAPFLRRCMEAGWITSSSATRDQSSQRLSHSTPQGHDRPSDVQQVRLQQSHLQTSSVSQHRLDLKSLPPEIRSLIYRMAFEHQAPVLRKARPIQINDRNEWWSYGDFTSNLIKQYARGCSCTDSLSPGHDCHPFAIMQLDRKTRDEARFVCVQVISERLNFILNCENANKLLISAAFVKRASVSMLRSLPYIIFKLSCEADASRWEVSVWPRRLRYPAWYEWEYEISEQAYSVAQDQVDRITTLLDKAKIDTKRRRIISKPCMIDILNILAFEKGFSLLTHDVTEYKGDDPA